jgi:hypothetical protein
LADENAARVSMTAFWWRRRDLTREQADRHWRDVHGPGSARLPGQYLYRQLHCDPQRTDVFAAVDGIDQAPPGEEPQGIANVLYLDEAGVATLKASPLVAEAVADNANMIDRNATYWTADGDAHTYVDRTGDPVPQGRVPYPSFAVLVRRREGCADETFRTALRGLAERWSGDDGVLRVRLSLLGPPEGVAEDVCQAWLDLVLDDERTAKRLLRPGDEACVSAVRALPIRERYTLVHDGKPTAA